MFKVQKKMCPTCIYRPDTPLDLKRLELAIKDRSGFFFSHRVCHHSDDVCCRGFWENHKNEFQMGQIAQRMNMVEIVDVDKYKDTCDAKTK